MEECNFMNSDTLLDAYCGLGYSDEDDFDVTAIELETEADVSQLLSEFRKASEESGSDAGVVSPVKKADTEPDFLNDLTNMQTLVEQLKDDYVYDALLKCWRHFDGSVWEKIEKSKMLTVAGNCFRHCYMQTVGDAKLQKHFSRSCNKGRLTAALEIASSNEELERTDFNMNKKYLCVENGVVDLATGRIAEHNAELWQTQKVDVDYDPNAYEGSRFQKFLREIADGDEAWVEYLQVIFGAALLGKPQQQFYFLLGEGANGKSVLTEALTNVIYAFQFHLPANELTAKHNRASGHSAFFVKTVSKRFIFSSELEEGRSINESFIKNITGGTEISLRDVGAQSISFTPEFTLFIDTNVLPPIRGRDWGIRRRAVVVPFNRIFSEDEQDLTLKDKLASVDERQAILCWLIDGAMQVADKPHLVFNYPASVAVETAAYRGQVPVAVQNEQSVQRFMDACLVKEEGAEVQAAVLYENYVDFCRQYGYSYLKSRTFGELAKRLLGQQFRKAGARYYSNVALIN